jgi:hypothetical protein
MIAMVILSSVVILVVVSTHNLLLCLSFLIDFVTLFASTIIVQFNTPSHMLWFSSSFQTSFQNGNDNIQVNGIANVFASGGAGDDDITIDNSQVSVLLGDEGSMNIHDRLMTRASSSGSMSYFSFSTISQMNTINSASMIGGNDNLKASSTLSLPFTNCSRSVIFGGQANDTILTNNVCATICADECSCKYLVDLLHLHSIHRCVCAG